MLGLRSGQMICQGPERSTQRWPGRCISADVSLSASTSRAGGQGRKGSAREGLYLRGSFASDQSSNLAVFEDLASSASLMSAIEHYFHHRLPEGLARFNSRMLSKPTRRAS